MLAGLQPMLGLDATGQAILQADYGAHLAAIPGGRAKDATVALGARAAGAVLARRQPHLRPNPPRVDDIVEARILAGFHFRTSDLQGAERGGKVGGFVAGHGLRLLR
jgi:hypothetical protein